MKTLLLIRHAKSSWEHPGLSDFDRPLNGRGERDAPLMASRLKSLNIIPDQMVSSPAKRALATCDYFADALKFSRSNVIVTRDLYHAGEEGLLSVIMRLKDLHDGEVALVFGHNPGLTEFANLLINENIDNIPTAGIVSCSLKISRWRETTWSCGKLEFFDYPKRVSE